MAISQDNDGSEGGFVIVVSIIKAVSMLWNSYIIAVEVC